MNSLMLSPSYNTDEEQDKEDNGRDPDPGDLPEHAGLGSQHQPDVLAHISVAVDPHQAWDRQKRGIS